MLIIGFLLINSPKQTIALPASALAEKNALVDMRLLADGRLVATHPQTDEVNILSDETPINQTVLKQLYSLAIVVTEDNSDTTKKLKLI